MDTPDFFAGARLGGARVKAGISLEKAAKDTRIRVQRLREIEADDFSGFTHPTYARLFLLDYADYLGIAPDEIRPLLPDRAGSAGGGFQYINALACEPSSPVVSMRPKRSRLILVILLTAGLVLVLAAAGLFAYSTVNKIKRVAGSAALSGKSIPEPPAASPSPPPTVEIPPSASPGTVESGLPVVNEPSSSPLDGSGSPTPAP